MNKVLEVTIFDLDHVVEKTYEDTPFEYKKEDIIKEEKPNRFKK